MDDFDKIIEENYERVNPNVIISDEDFVDFQCDSGSFEERTYNMKRKATTLDGFIVLVLLIVSVSLLAWAMFDFGWDLVRFFGGLVCFSLLLQFSARVSGRE